MMNKTYLMISSPDPIQPGQHHLEPDSSRFLLDVNFHHADTLHEAPVVIITDTKKLPSTLRQTKNPLDPAP